LRSLLTADARAAIRSRQTFILNLFVPILILIVTDRAGSGRNAARLRSTSLGRPGFEIGMALTFGLIASALMGYSATVARDREAGVFQRLRVAPAPTWAIMLSRLIVQFGAAIIMSIVVIVVGSIIHHVTFGAATYLLLFVVAICGAAMFLGIGQALVGLIGSAAAVNAVGRMLYIVLILLGVLGVSGVLGDTFQTFSSWTPVGAVITLFGAVQDLSSWSVTDTGAAFACAGYLLVSAGIGIRWFRWDAR
jgi:ABC-2 type transport system permease protein